MTRGAIICTLVLLASATVFPSAAAEPRVTICAVELELAGAAQGSTTCEIPAGARRFEIETSCTDPPVAAQVIVGSDIPWGLFGFRGPPQCAVQLDQASPVPDPRGLRVIAQGRGSIRVVLTAEVQDPVPPPPPPPPPTVSVSTTPGGARWVVAEIALGGAGASLDLVQNGGTAPTSAGHHVYASTGSLTWFVFAGGTIGGLSAEPAREQTSISVDAAGVSERHTIVAREERAQGAAVAGLRVRGTGTLLVGLWIAGQANETILRTALEPGARVTWSDEGDETFIVQGPSYVQEGASASAYVASLGGNYATLAYHTVTSERPLLATFWPSLTPDTQRMWVDGPDGRVDCAPICDVAHASADHTFAYAGVGLGIHEVDAPTLSGALVRLPPP